MSNGRTTPQEDKCANAVADLFGIPISDALTDRYTFQKVYIGGFRFELGYRTLIGGDHYNHVHVGVQAG